MIDVSTSDLESLVGASIELGDGNVGQVVCEKINGKATYSLAGDS